MNFLKGYKNDAGVDIVLDKDIIFEPNSINIIDLGISVKVKKGEMAYLISRTSAAKQGILVMQCPIDADYTGTINAITYNISRQTVIYPAGNSFCQIVYVPIKYRIKCATKKKGRRTNSKFGETDKK